VKKERREKREQPERGEKEREKSTNTRERRGDSRAREGLSVLQVQLKERNEMWKQRIFKSFEKMVTRKMRAVRRVPDGEMR